MVKIFGRLFQKILENDKYSIFEYNKQYDKWLEQNKFTQQKISKIKNQIDYFQSKPKISIAMPVYNVDEVWLRKAIQSVLNQFYTNWELCIVDDASTKSHIKSVLQEFQDLDNRIKIKYLNKNLGISGALNESITMVTGTYVGFLDNDDELYVDALYEVVKRINEKPQIEILYTDEDKIDRNGKRIEPFYKPDWSPQLLQACNYITHFTIIKTELLRTLGGFRKSFDGSQDYDLFLRVTEKTKNIEHIPKILYGWRKIPGSAADSIYEKPYAYKAAIKSLEAALTRHNLKGKIESYNNLPYYRIRYEFGNPMVSIIIFANGNLKNLNKCLRSLQNKNNYLNYEIIIVHNADELHPKKISCNYKILKIKETNLSKIYNFATSHAKGDFIVFLTDNIINFSSNWLESMLEQIFQDDVGVVGPLIISKSDYVFQPAVRIYHAGIILGLDGLTGNAFNGRDSRNSYYFGFSNTIRNCSAVSNECLMVKKNILDKINGWEEKVSNKYNDVDLCLRIQKLGYQIVYAPFTKLIRNNVKENFNFEDVYFQKKWENILNKPDPYYNVNLSHTDGGYMLKNHHVWI